MPGPQVKDDAQGANPFVEVRNLSKHFPIKTGLWGRVGSVKAVERLSFSIAANQTLGLVGESGCGKTTAGRTILRLIEPTSGSVLFKGENIYELGRRQMRALRKHMQIIFQDPYGSLNPRMTIEQLIGEAIEVHGIARGSQKREKVIKLLDRVGLSPGFIDRYPHEFSGGQRQRIGIARALALEPEFIVCDEVVSALDVSVQAQILNLLMDLQRDYQLAYLFISHDLSVVRHISHHVAVMYLGQIVEYGSCESVYTNPRHPYTRALLSAIPSVEPTRRSKHIFFNGDMPSPMEPPKGCAFHPRCPNCFSPCSRVEPPVFEIEDQRVKCHLYDPRYAEDGPGSEKQVMVQKGNN